MTQPEESSPPTGGAVHPDSSAPPHLPRILLLFLDGVGIGIRDAEVNPFARASLPFLEGAFAGGLPWLDDPGPTPASASIGGLGRTLGLDANLGIPGLPQSGTGQISIFTGRNGPRLFGRHFGPWPPVALRPLLAAENLLVRARQGGREVAFANAYPAGWPGSLSTRRHAVPPLAALAAGVLSRNVEDLVRGTAVASEIVNDGWRRYTGRTDLPRVLPEEAGGVLARIALQADLTVFAHYQTDHAGHRGGMEGSVASLERVDAFLGGLARELGETVRGPRPVWVLGCSDHGNIEDIRGGHTRNPALGFVLGMGAGAVDSRGRPGPGSLPDPLVGVRALTGLAPAILRALQVPSPSLAGSVAGEGAAQGTPAAREPGIPGPE